ncbi:MAG: class I SAM-dependent methyltransferase [Sphingobium sp.]
MLEGLLERLSDVRRTFADILVIGCPDGSARDALTALDATVTCCDPGLRNALTNEGIQAEEDTLPFAAGSFDLVLACGTLDSVNDLPGALIQIGRSLRPDGLFLGACVGAGSLPKMRRALMEAEGDKPVPHLHPQIDVRAAGDLLARAGFAMPVADIETLTVRYSSLVTLMHDLRGMAAGNVMAPTRRGSLSRSVLMKAAGRFASLAEEDGRTNETFSLLYLSGWKPDPTQPQAARRGSGQVSLAAALGRKD